MARGRPDVRLICTVLARGAIVVMAAAILMLTPSRGASAAGVGDLTGVTCMDVYFDNAPPQTKGQPPGAEDARVTKILSRIEMSDQPFAWDITSVSYSGPGELVPTKPPSADSCKDKTDGNQLNPSVPFQQVDVGDRPTATATLVSKGSDQNLEWTVCKWEPDLLGGMWVLTEFNVVFADGKPATQNFGDLTAYLDPNSCTTGAAIQYTTLLVSTERTMTKGGPQPGVADDWDGDGCSDWDELAPPPVVGRGDPFNPYDCPPVGGMAELPDVAGAPLESADPSGGGVGLIVVVAAAVTVGAVALGGPAWYARRRGAR